MSYFGKVQMSCFRTLATCGNASGASHEAGHSGESERASETRCCCLRSAPIRFGRVVAPAPKSAGARPAPD
jgi:hypothetical protein